MRMNKILVPTDFSETAMHALSQATRLAKHYDSEIFLFHVVEPYGEPPPHMAARVSEYVDHIKESAETELSSVAARLEAEGVVARVEMATHVAPVEAIADIADAVDPDLVVIGTHGRRGFKRFLLGSVTEKILRTIPASVMSLSLEAPLVFDQNVDAPAGRVLVPVDFSECSKHALDAAFSLVKGGGEVVVVHVVPVPQSPALYPGPLVPVTNVDPELMHRARSRLEEWVDGREARIELRVGEASSSIVELSDTQAANMIVMGTRGLTGLDHFLLGSVAERTVRRATVPVLTVH